MSSVQLEPEDLPDPTSPNHGMTRAAWVLNTGLVVSSVVIGVGIMFDRPVLTWIGVSLAVLSLIAGGILRALGHGQPLR
jgi:hypothetical protein